MLCLHGKPAATSTTEKGTFWFCDEPFSCHFICSEEEAFLYDKAIKEFLATKQDRPKCCSVTPEASAERNYARIRVAKTLNFGRSFFTCSKEKDRCDYFEWGDEIIIPKPLCQHGKPCKLQTARRENRNYGRKFLCCPEKKENRCRFFRWFNTPSPREPDEDPLESCYVTLFSNPPSYKYTVKKTGVVFTSYEKDRKKAYDEFLHKGEISSVSDGLFSPVQKRKTDVATPSGEMKSSSECNGNDATACKKRKTLLDA